MASNVTDGFQDDSFPINFEDCENENLNSNIISIFPAAEKPSSAKLQIENHCDYKFNEKLLEQLLKKSEHNIKISKNANLLFAELMRLYSVEIITRAGEQAIKEGMKNVTQEHLEKILPQFLLDFN